MKRGAPRFQPLCLAALLGVSPLSLAGDFVVAADPARQAFIVADRGSNLVLRLNLAGRCEVEEVWVRGRSVARPGAGAFTGIRISNQWFTTRSNQVSVKANAEKNRLVVSGIRLGPPEFPVEERWTFSAAAREPAGGAPGLGWKIERRYPGPATVQDSVMPAWNFGSLTTWTGALLDNGGVAWNRYLDTPNATYAVQAGGFVCWNPTANDALAIRATPGRGSRQPFQAHARFTHEADGTLTTAFSIAPEALRPKHDLRRFHPSASDLWAPFRVTAGATAAEFSLTALDYEQTFDLGELKGLPEASIRELLHTIGRYGVVDRRIVGANGWRSGFKCLHEQWFSQIGIALQDADYLANCAETFDHERLHALQADGRLKSRWWYVSADAMPGTFDSRGYYEAQWGILMDSQTCFPICVAELFDLTGDRSWLAGQKSACERMLDYLLRRDADDDGLVEMHNNFHSDQQGSDWIDVIWAAHENALVNAELYHALTRWAELEELLGDRARAAQYRQRAAKLKRQFNRTTAEGGFWDPAKEWFIYWRDRDDSLHGNNLVTPVNFAAIAYGLCDAPGRRQAILDRIEAEMQKEKLFFWPLSFFPYEPDEGHAKVNYPFPNYENGDLFLSWGELGVRAYAETRPDVALRYIRNTLERYERDGLSFQRYQRRTQQGAGEDILAGNCMPVVGLYRNLYGVQPKYNRLFLDPRLTPELAGTRLRYRLRGQTWWIDLAPTAYAVSTAGFTVRHGSRFGVNVAGERLEFFPATHAGAELVLERKAGGHLEVEVDSWSEGLREARQWTLRAGDRSVRLTQTIAGLEPGLSYELRESGRKVRSLTADASGRVRVRSRLGPEQVVSFSLHGQAVPRPAARQGQTAIPEGSEAGRRSGEG